MQAHAEDLRAEIQHQPGADELIDAICRRHRPAELREASLSTADRAMLDFAEKLTREPSATTRDDLDRLRQVGFDDTAIHDIVQVAALFNYYVRLAEGLGIELEPEWGEVRIPE